MGSNGSKQKIHSELTLTRQSNLSNPSSQYLGYNHVHVNSAQIIRQERHIQNLQQSWRRKDLQPGETPDTYELSQREIILQKELEKLYSLRSNSVNLAWVSASGDASSV